MTTAPDPRPLRGLWWTLASFVLAVTLVLTGTIVAITMSEHSVQVGEQQWCQTLDLLASHPVPKPADPKANPSREQGYLFYLDLQDLRHRFGCI